MRSPRAGLADLKRLSEAAARTRERVQTLAKTQSPPAQPEPLAAADEKLLAQATRTVQPLGRAQPRLLHKPSVTRSEITQLTERRQRAVGEKMARLERVSDGAELTVDDQPELAWAAPGIGPAVLRQLRRAFWPVGARLDLHGLNSDQARARVLAFIENSQNHRTRCVCIIHGVGYGSANGQAVLPVRVRQWLKQLSAVSAFAQAPQAHGGAGALLALIRSP